MSRGERIPAKEEFPADFSVQRIETVSAKALKKLAEPEIAAYLRQNPSVAEDLLLESYDKRFTPLLSLLNEATNTVSDGSLFVGTNARGVS
jgi:hypothetical protein